jgi:hypothetical protein
MPISSKELSGERMGHMHQQNVGLSYNGVPVMDGFFDGKSD